MPTASPPSANALQRIGWRGVVPPLPDDCRLARVTAQHRAGYEAHDGDHAFNAQPAPRFLKRKLDPSERPAVGDFVVVQAGAPPHIIEVLERRSMFRRAAAGEKYQRQTIATNIDVVFVLTGLDGDFNPARIERYLALVETSGAQTVVVLTKRDAVDDAQAGEAIDALVERLPRDIPVLAINGKDPASAGALARYLAPGTTAVLVGSSGAGKSTLTNTLLGEQRMATATTRADDRGRHTTTHRALLALPGGACLIDTPGMRELKLSGDEDLELFSDIEALGEQCRFADCSHGGEPGCAVREAIDAGRLDHERWHHYQKLRDQRIDQAARFDERQRATQEPIRPQRRRSWQERE